MAIREFPLKTGYADYLMFVDRKAIGAIEAKAEGTPLSGIELQSEKYSSGLPEVPPAWRKPLPFLYESTGVETQFTNRLDPQPRSRALFSFHRPETLLEWIQQPDTLRARLQCMPPLTTGLWSAQAEAIDNLEVSLAEDRPRALIQMATGSVERSLSSAIFHRLIKDGCAKGPPLPLVVRRQPGPPDVEGVSAVRHARRRPQVHRAVQRAAPSIQHVRPREPRLYNHHSAPLLHTLRRRGVRPTERGRFALRDGGAPDSSPKMSAITPPSRSSSSTSSSPMSATARSTTCGGRCSSISTPI